MKHLLLPFMLLSLLGSSNAQSYFPTGATWTYHAVSIYPPGFSYTTVESAGDTVINGNTFKHLEGSVNCSFGNDEFVQQVGDKVYRLNKCDSSITLLYDFGASIGDTIVVPDPCSFGDTLRLVVDTIKTMDINGNGRKHFEVTQLDSTSSMRFDGDIFEGIGNRISFYPMFVTCDPVGGPLRCYSDTVIGEFNTGMYDGVCDTVYVGIDEEESHRFSLYPNPTSGDITIDLGELMSDVKLTLTNHLGQTIVDQHYQSTNRIEMQIEAPKGMYFLKLETSDGKILMRSVVVE